MPKLPISKCTEAKAVAEIWNMGAESLPVKLYCDLERVIKALCANRNIDNELVACEQIVLSGKEAHTSDCATSDAPAYLPAPCDCDFKKDVPEIPGFEGTREALNDLTVRSK